MAAIWPDDIFICILFNNNVQISIKISVKFVPNGPINDIHALVQIMAWRQPGDIPLSEPVTTRSLTHTCVTRHQCVKKRDSDLSVCYNHIWLSAYYFRLHEVGLSNDSLLQRFNVYFHWLRACYSLFCELSQLRVDFLRYGKFRFYFCKNIRSNRTFRWQTHLIFFVGLVLDIVAPIKCYSGFTFIFCIFR